MRFKEGDKVEVMNNKKVPVTWRMAEVVSHCGKSYLVRYDSYPGIAYDQIVEKVPRKFLRPCPPLMQGLENCAAGDLVEVFHESSWKIAAILKKMDEKEGNTKSMVKNLYLVRLLGSSYGFVVGRWNIRMRQTWHDGKWNLVGKRSQDGKDVMASELSTSNINFQEPQLKARAKCQSKIHLKDFQDDAMLGKPPMAVSRPLKRILPYFSTMEAQNRHAKKLRPIQKEGWKHYERREYVAYPREVMGEKNTPASRDDSISNGSYQMEVPNPNVVPGDYLLRRSKPSNSDSDCCSVGSCSATKQGPENYFCHFRPANCHETDTSCSDAESSSAPGCMRETSSLPPKEGFEVSIRTLELCAYRRTLEALYASGPLSWDQEAMLTNLRIMLHISNDEHLQELRHLIPPKTAIGVI